ncbi:MAG: hypothetical protein QM523_00120 [Candidatus Pacebacteria bacterium]|jgi:hypothetical protein|nr:hypothetical protein [Candidatus Paceibacterota bacterium]
MNRQEEMRQQVTDFHRRHPEVWELFVKFTFEMINRGYKNYSVNAIFERIRWEKDSIGGDGVTSFKLNNNYRAFYSRRFMRVYPENEGFFRTRQQPSEEQFPTHRPELSPSYYA